MSTKPYKYPVRIPFSHQARHIVATSPSLAAANYSNKQGLSPGAIVRVQDKRGVWMRYRVGVHPRAMRPIGPEGAR